MIDYWHEVDGSGAVALNMPAGGSVASYDCGDGGGEAAFCASGWAGGAQVCCPGDGLEAAPETVLARNGVEGKELSCFIPHQANKRIISFDGGADWGCRRIVSSSISTGMGI